MTGTRKWIIFLAALLVMINGALYAVLADHDDDHDSEGKRSRHQERYRGNSKDHKKRYLTPVDSLTYVEACR